MSEECKGGVKSRVEGLEHVMKATLVGQTLPMLASVLSSDRCLTLFMAKSFLQSVTNVTVTAARVRKRMDVIRLIWQWFYQFYPFSDKNGDLLISKKEKFKIFYDLFFWVYTEHTRPWFVQSNFLFRSMIIFIIVFFSSVFNSKAMDSLIVLCFP